MTDKLKLSRILSLRNGWETKSEELKSEKYLTKRIFSGISENMHYEIFKYLDSHNLLEIRALKLGGYQLISNKTLRSRIKNYFKYIPFKLSEDLPISLKIKGINLIFEQMGREKLIYEGVGLEMDEINKLSEILEFTPELKKLNLGIYIYIYII